MNTVPPETNVVYLALGARRVRAAAAHTARLAADGHRVTLARTDDPAWDSVAVAPAVDVLPVRSAEEARRLARAAAVTYAGDAEALAAVYGLDTRLEPAAEPGRRTGPADLAVVTPWYPSPDDPFAGAFVRGSTSAVRDRFERISVLHTQSWYYPPGRLRGQLLGVAAERQAVRCGNAVVSDEPEGEITRVAVPTPAGGDYLAYGDEQTVALRAALPTGRIEAPVVHAHTGIMAGVVAARLARPDARLVVTEHSTFLAKVFAQPGARRRYAEMLDRADALLCVSGSLRDQLADFFPGHTDKLHVVPNAIDFDAFAQRPEPPKAPDRWLYLGRLMEHKGVLTLVDAFTALAAEEPELTLTLVGSGPLAGTIDERAAAAGLTGRITVRPPVGPEEVTALLHEHDVLAHASRRETFGMTIVEALATGTPVLVALSEGPAETLAGLHESAGAVFEPTTDPAAIVAAYRQLKDRLARLDLPGARAALDARYGRVAVADQLLAAYSGGHEPGAPMAAPARRRIAGSPLPEATVRTARRVVRKLF
ncbi:glycosyltransferase family 4 protein [Actinoplanes regularis]|uniref:Glycogen(Starch) synthase n=1 Tax=Actinoplanes regularis TaxID=52697 RepID=A0A238W3V8_9ACTN|nr:glycosyltransferase family 4 protein [Actinoplanes regularis]SNR40853.1 glycogen(starch) synthase [Actinoplanes regularis]